ncbi:universal stress protein [Streptomyces sp. NPDC046942]|uniref:universal stress protein n=1 Tax=Streptomyces sp. NPDC046942 TaxID=3155137 RepID=UPI0034089867
MNQPTPGTAPRIVVGVDGSPSSERALAWGGYLASAMGGVLEAVTAWQSPPSWTGVADNWDPATEAGAMLSGRCTEGFGDAQPRNLRLTVREGAAVAVLLTTSVGARMLVLGSRGHGGFAGLLLGSVSAACAEHAPCPTLIIHGDGLPPAVAPDAGPNSRAAVPEGTR